MMIKNVNIVRALPHKTVGDSGDVSFLPIEESM